MPFAMEKENKSMLTNYANTVSTEEPVSVLKGVLYFSRWALKRSHPADHTTSAGQGGAQTLVTHITDPGGLKMLRTRRALVARVLEVYVQLGQLFSRPAWSAWCSLVLDTEQCLLL